MARRYVVFTILLLLSLVIRIFSSYPGAVEYYYSTGIYPGISLVQRMMFGWLPLSVGDILYFLTGCWLIGQCILIFRKIRTNQINRRFIMSVGRRFVTGILVVYVFFNLLWGLNYNRMGIGIQLKLNTDMYSRSDLLTVTGLLADKLNELQSSSLHTRAALGRKSDLFGKAVDAYRSIDHKTPLHYHVPSVKPSLYSYLGNYLGFTGYYNPFTGEAQVNTTVPLFIQPFTTCHEIGHQLGYAKESEANFAGYLSAAASTDTAYLYSVYFDMYSYAARYLYYSDSTALLAIRDRFNPGVMKDRQELSDFLIRYSSPVGDVIDRLYSKYLKANQQPSGKMSYNEVVAMLIAYYKQHGRI